MRGFTYGCSLVCTGVRLLKQRFSTRAWLPGVVYFTPCGWGLQAASFARHRTHVRARRCGRIDTPKIKDLYGAFHIYRPHPIPHTRTVVTSIVSIAFNCVYCVQLRSLGPCFLCRWPAASFTITASVSTETWASAATKPFVVVFLQKFVHMTA